MDDLGLEVYSGPPGRKTGGGPPDLPLDRAKAERDVGADLIFGDRPATGVGSDLIFGADRTVALSGNPASVGQTPRSAADDSLGELLRGDHRRVDTGLVFIRVVSGKYKGAWFTLDVSGSTTVSQVSGIQPFSMGRRLSRSGSQSVSQVSGIQPFSPGHRSVSQ